MVQRKAEQTRKITVNGVMGAKVDLEELLKTTDKRQDLCAVYGIARRYKPDQSPLGSFLRFYGKFKAINLKTGEVIEAPQAILPGTVQDALYGAMGTGDAVVEVQFAVKIGVKYQATAATKYVFTVENLMQPAENDPMSLLEKGLTEQKLLPAPKK